MIVSATPDDAADVIALWQACDLTRPWNDPQSDFDRALASAQSTILVLREGSGIIGSVMVGDDGPRGWVYYLAVHPDEQRGGMGRALMEAAEAWLRERGCSKFQFMVRTSNATALGYSSNAAGVNSVSVGDSSASGAKAVGIGFQANASGRNSVAIGDRTAAADDGVAIGGQRSAAVTSAQYLFGTMMLWLVLLFTKKEKLSVKESVKLLLSGIPFGLTGIFYYQALQSLSASLAIVFLFQFV